MVELNTMNTNRAPSTRCSIPPINGSESVIVRNAYKKYETDELVLNGLNLTVAEGTIYALLGPSGCGKTTLLNCIVGQTALDAGIIRLKITKRSQLGYMPQFLSLHTPLSIYENFYFYGYIFDLSSDEIRARADRLISFLELPHGDCTLKTLSGGQQRRVSVAIAFLHQPKLLILDEPTVGLDPVLCQKIWMKLHDFIKEGASIVITTHYIQEARQAHTIGLMRGGVLLAEEKPDSLLEKCECDNLEEAFLKLSHEQESKLSNRKTTGICPKTAHPAKTYFEEDDTYFTRAKFFAIMYKNTIFLRREFVFIIFILVLPTVQAYIFNLVLGVKPKNLKVAVINEEIPYANCDKSSYDGCFLDSSQNVTISCLFLELLKNETYIFREYKNTEEALHDIRKNKVWAILNFPKNFTNSLAQRVSRGVFTDIEHIANSTINSWVDLSNRYIGSSVKYDVIRSMFSLLKKALTICGENPKMGTIAVSFETPIFGSYNENFVTYASAAMICLCCFFSSSTSTSMLIVSEKSEGMVQRMIVTGATVFEMVFSLLLIQIIGQIISVPMVMMIMYWFFGNPMHGSITTLLSLLGLTGFTGVLYGTTLAVLNKDLIMTAYCGVGMNIVMCLTTGLLWPIEAEHYVLKNITWMLPLTWIADAARGISSKSYSFFHPTVFRGFASAIVWNCIFLYVIYFCLKYKKGAISRAT